MKVILIENTSKEKIGELALETQPRSGEWVELNESSYSVHRIIHTKDGIKLMVIGVR